VRHKEVSTLDQHEGPPLLSSDLRSILSPLAIAAMQLAERRMALAVGLPAASVDEIFAATTASRERAHEYADEILAHLAAQEPVPSLPCGELAAARRARLAALATAAFDFRVQHPGCVRRGARPRYSAPYRQFVIELQQRHADLTAAEFAAAIRLPLSTLEAWMHRARAACAACAACAAPHADEPHAGAAGAIPA
jgi:protein-disulfide isomerase-like protein with CxxC motif